MNTNTISAPIYCIEYSNIESMKEDTSLSVGDICSTLGYYSPNDGGGAKYMIVLSATEDFGYVHGSCNYNT